MLTVGSPLFNQMAEVDIFTLMVSSLERSDHSPSLERASTLLSELSPSAISRVGPIWFPTLMSDDWSSFDSEGQMNRIRAKIQSRVEEIQQARRGRMQVIRRDLDSLRVQDSAVARVTVALSESVDTLVTGSKRLADEMISVNEKLDRLLIASGGGVAGRARFAVADPSLPDSVLASIPRFIQSMLKSGDPLPSPLTSLLEPNKWAEYCLPADHLQRMLSSYRMPADLNVVLAVDQAVLGFVKGKTENRLLDAILRDLSRFAELAMAAGIAHFSTEEALSDAAADLMRVLIHINASISATRRTYLLPATFAREHPGAPPMDAAGIDRLVAMRKRFAWVQEQPGAPITSPSVMEQLEEQRRRDKTLVASLAGKAKQQQSTPAGSRGRQRSRSPQRQRSKSPVSAPTRAGPPSRSRSPAARSPQASKVGAKSGAPPRQ